MTIRKEKSPMVDVMKFFELRPAEFRPLWAALTERDKEQLRAGIADGSLTY
jgi:hypothetical protein